MTKAAAAPAVAPGNEGLSFVAECLEQRAGQRSTVTVAIRAPSSSVDELVAAAPRVPAILWDPPAGPSAAGSGIAVQLVGEGAERADQVRARAEAIWKDLVFCAEEPQAPRPRFFGGFAFQPARARTSPWQGFGDARFILPRLTYLREGRDSWLLVSANADDLSRPAGRRSVLADAERALASLRADSPPAEGAAPALRAREGMTLDAWRELVQSIVSLIEMGSCRKIVAARRLRLEFEEPPDELVVLRELRKASRSCTRFFMRFEQATFLGATPELLVRKAGDRLETEALAGSIRHGHAEALMQSSKDLDEHRLVLSEIVRCLEPVCNRIEHPGTPAIRELRHILHLRTPVAARTDPALHVLSLVALLHPTPAVGGVPRDAALAFIAEHEPVERGWYAAPVGWFDAAGDGEFDVALRSGVLSGGDAYLFAGSGIVRESEPSSEYAETELKLASLSTALGVEE